MFKKGYAAQGQNLLSKKDLKGLKSQLAESYPALDGKKVDELLPEGQAKVSKLDNRSLLYSCGDGAPLFFDAEGRGELYPTLQTLWQHPNMMQELTIHPQVSHYVLKGADLMLPGVLVPANGVAGFGSITKGQPRCIKIEGNPYPIAIGKMVVNQTQMEKLKGKGMEVLHVYKDLLWAESGKAVPNAGFTEKEDEVTPCDDSSWTPGDNATAASSPKAGPSAAPEASSSPKAAPAAAPEAALAAGSGVNAKPAEDWTQDDLLDFTFMQAFKLTLTDDKSLPIEASELYEKHMKPARPEGTTLDVKKSAHKQIGKYLNVMRKSKAIDVTDKKGVISVSKVDRGHKVFTQFTEKFASDMTGVSVAASSAAAGPVSTGLRAPIFTAMWTPGHYLEGLWKETGTNKKDLLTWEQVRGVLAAYVEKAELGKADSPVKLNEDLLTALYKTAGGQKKDQTWPDDASWDELEDKMLDRMKQHTCVDVVGIGPITRTGGPVNIQVSLSRKGAHNVTRIVNLEAYGLDPEAMGDELKKKLNCTANLEDVPGKNSKDKMLQLQGHVDKELATYLEQKYGITQKFLEVK